MIGDEYAQVGAIRRRVIPALDEYAPKIHSSKINELELYV